MAIQQVSKSSMSRKPASNGRRNRPVRKSVRDEVDALLERARNGDTEAWDALYNKYHKLVVWVANKYRTKKVEWDDLLGIAFEGFVKAVFDYDSTIALFTTYLAWRVKSQVLNYFSRLNTKGRTATIVSLDTKAVEDDEITIEDMLGYEEDFRVGAIVIEEAVNRVVRDYSDKKKKLIRMYLNDIRREEIAKAINVHLSYVAIEIKRFRRKVIKELARVGYD